MTRRSLQNARAIVTGASSGIGRAIATELARRGCRLLITARRESQLAELGEQLDPTRERVRYFAGDLTEPSTRDSLLTSMQSHFGGLDILVNNAGVGAVGPFIDADPTRLQRIFDVDFVAPVELIRKALPLMQRAQAPIIVNVGSVLGHRAVPNKSEYCAAKFAMHGFSDALRAELRPVGIDLLLVSPSTTDSEFFECLLENPKRSTRARGMSPQKVARKTVQAIAAGRSEIILSAGGQAIVWLDRLCPPLANWIVAKFG